MAEAVAERGVPDETISLVGSLSAEHGARSVEQLLAMSPRPTAIVAGGNQVLAGCIRALQRNGIRIPDDMSVVTCDDMDLSELHEPPIAVIARDTLLLGRTAAELLLERLGGGGAADGPAAHDLHGAPELRPGAQRRLSPSEADRRSRRRRVGNDCRTATSVRPSADRATASLVA